MSSAPFFERQADRETPPDWSDTAPACFRSEAFAEDLPDALPTRANEASARAAGGTQAARDRRRLPRWGAVLALIGRRPAAAS